MPLPVDLCGTHGTIDHPQVTAKPESHFKYLVRCSQMFQIMPSMCENID